MHHTATRATVTPPRCPGCTGPLECFEQQLYCADCTVVDVTPCFTARAAGGHFVHEGGDLAELVAWVAELVYPGGGEVMITDGAGRVVCVVTDTGAVVRAR
jgi:hypothetical protein